MCNLVSSMITIKLNDLTFQSYSLYSKGERVKATDLITILRELMYRNTKQINILNYLSQSMEELKQMMLVP